VNTNFRQVVRKYFKHLNFFREDIKEIICKIGLNYANLKSCDFGCGSGITTFALALELDGSVCIGLDKFPKDTPYSFDKIQEITESIRIKCMNKEIHSFKLKESISKELCELYENNLYPVFLKGDIVKGKNLLEGIDLPFCQKLLPNIHEDKITNKDLRKNNLIKSINNIKNCLSTEGYLLSVEYTGFDLIPIFKECNLETIKTIDFNRNEIRSKGRTEVISRFTAFLCRKKV
jgi:hypothetical protein